MDREHIKQRDAAFIAATYSRFDVVLERGEGATLYDADGRSYVDFGAGIAVNTFGVCDAEFNRAVTEQLSKLAHASNLYYTAPDGELAEILCDRTGAKKVFFGNSGAEANECAIKAARKYSYDRYGRGRDVIVTLTDSFHGRTVTTLSATGQEIFHQYFFPFTGGFRYAEAGNYADTLEKIDASVCAVMMEPVQGESGVNVLDAGYVQAVAKYCAEHDILLIVDEVQTGNGRTGSLFAYERYGIAPDLVTTAKGLGGGLPIGACLFFAKTEHTLGAGTHGSTFGGNPVVCAGAVSVLTRLTPDFLSEVARKGALIKTSLERLGLAVSGLGLMLGVAVGDAKALAAECARRGLLILTAKTRLRLLPPLNITDTELDRGLRILIGVLRDAKEIV